MTINSTWFLALVFSMALLGYSCTSTTEETVKIAVSAQAEGPFFEGPNSLLGNVDVSSYTTENGTQINSDNIVKAKLKTITISLKETDSIGFDAFTSASFQIVAGELPMTSAIAILNPIETSEKTIELMASDEAELTDYLKNKKFTCILDLELVEYLEKQSINAEINLEFALEIKK